jgi:glucose-6-phosphate 1-dehydrogenase
MSAQPVSTIIILGASGDLAKKKIYPVLWSLYLKERIAPRTRIIGYARSKMNNADLVAKLRPFIKVPEGSEQLFEEFLGQLTYFAGGHGSCFRQIFTPDGGGGGMLLSFTPLLRLKLCHACEQ